MYPERYRLPAVTRHILELLERRRPALPVWDAGAERKLAEEADAALETAGRQFRDVADDPAHWQAVERAVREVALPRYFRLARAEWELESKGYGLWRGGDLLARVTYGAVGLLLAAILWRAPGLPKWLEPLPLLLFIFGPILPDVQRGLIRRRYRRQLVQLIQEMGEEAAQQAAYRPLDSGPVGLDETLSTREKEKA